MPVPTGRHVQQPAPERYDDKEASSAQSSGEDVTTKKHATTDTYPLTVSKNNKGWRRVTRNFSPGWFCMTMGTGIVSIIFITIPWDAQWLYYLGIITFVLNVCLFTLASVVSILRYIIWPEIWTVMMQDTTNCLFLATVPVGFSTIVDMWIFACVPAWGTWAAYFGWALWMIDSVVAVAITISLGVVLMSASRQRTLDSITAAQLLPIACTTVAAGTGSEVAAVLPDPRYQLGTILVCYVMWGMALPMALVTLAMYYQRLALHKMPPREIIVSTFLPIGTLGFAGYAVLVLGRVAKEVFPQTGTLDPLAGQIAYVLGFFVAFILWAWGLVWFAYALASIHKSRPLPFNMGWWSFVFPLGAFSLTTRLIGEELPNSFFRVLGTVFGTAAILLWIVIAVRTAMGAWSGELFNAPYLANLKQQGLNGGSDEWADKEQTGQELSDRTSDEPILGEKADVAPDVAV
ncbi:hypothetical protein EJ03DRAFT_282180 [Teratosphaeria nubilosa]|uniref:Sulfite efflux pump SSU1 n=1 Tax=Teratosphaeria nubilosa TaxID=161662 RepID=A0A6G1KUR8_9PEZI|nr:hypothetical protein EJ03DRAFT_282180 [Teratosphaeria nubilosa]